MPATPIDATDPGRPAAPRAFGRRMLEHWALDPSITYLNHGTVGATPRRVLAVQQAIRDEIERQPSQFLLRELSAVTLGVAPTHRPRLRAAAERVAEFLGARGDDLAFVDNATSGANAVLRSLPFAPGDEIVVTDHAYGAIAYTARYVARERGARVATATLPNPVRDAAGVVEAIGAVLTPRTRVVVVDHVAAESALILPVASIAARCRAAGALVLVDGAHAPGAIAVDIPALGVDWYVANLHKWAWAPRSCGIVWAAPARQPALHPTVISWGLDQGFTTEFDWVGTRDPSCWLAAPEAIEFMKELGVETVRGYNHALARRAGAMLAAKWETEVESPDAMFGSMLSLPLPARFGSTKEDAARLRDRLLFEDRIEIQLVSFLGRLRVRVSAQIYNDESDVERLAEAVARRA
jgi:isopenicillin-N epimerase